MAARRHRRHHDQQRPPPPGTRHQRHPAPRDEVAEVEAGELLEVDLEKGAIINPGKNRVYQAAPYPQAMLDIIAAGGLVEYTRQRLAQR